jgi:hypothetical protein
MRQLVALEDQAVAAATMVLAEVAQWAKVIPEVLALPPLAGILVVVVAELVQRVQPPVGKMPAMVAQGSNGSTDHTMPAVAAEAHGTVQQQE